MDGWWGDMGVNGRSEWVDNWVWGWMGESKQFGLYSPNLPTGNVKAVQF